MLCFLAEVKQNATKKTLTPPRPPPPRISNGVSLIQNNLFIYLNLHFGTPENVLCDGLCYAHISSY